jgi:hypothetical protein
VKAYLTAATLVLRRVPKVHGLKGWLSVATAVAVTVVVAVILLRNQRPGVGIPAEHSNAYGILHTRSDKSVYPYSVVAGGVHSAADARQAVAEDPLVRDHYSGVRVGSLAPAVLKTPVLAYLSYRKHGRIYWTAKALPMKAGEAVLADGSSMIRARCGNRISFTPQQPVITPASQEPNPTEFETAVATVSKAFTPIDRFPLPSSPAPVGVASSSRSRLGSADLGSGGRAGDATTGAQNGGPPSRASTGTSPAFVPPVDVLDAILPTVVIPSPLSAGSGEVWLFYPPDMLLVPRPPDAAYTVGSLSPATWQPYWKPGSIGSGDSLSDNGPPAGWRALSSDTTLNRISPQPESSDQGQMSELTTKDEIPPPPVIPEPQTYVLVGGGLLIVLLRAARRNP